LISDGKIVSPITVKTFLPAELDVVGLTSNQLLARLCAEATTIINAPDYAHLIRDLADRRRMITAAEELVIEARTAVADVPVKKLVAAAMKTSQRWNVNSRGRRGIEPS
jgi:replicative DNA helicase